jgi:hypothetical protein
MKSKKPKTLHNYWFDWEICRNAGLLQIDFEAFIHAGASNETKVNIISIHSSILML